ncbi:unnamed protein product, partial [Phaeothamnion confervicola]
NPIPTGGAGSLAFQPPKKEPRWWEPARDTALPQQTRPRLSSSPSPTASPEGDEGVVFNRLALLKRMRKRQETLKQFINGHRGQVGAPHNFGSARWGSRMLLLLKSRHDILSVFFYFSKWFSRAQRVAYLMAALLSLMAADATVFSVMYQDIGPCSSYTTRSTCLEKMN